MDECRKRLRKVGRKGVEGSSSDFYFASLDGNLVLDAGEACRLPWLAIRRCGSMVGVNGRVCGRGGVAWFSCGGGLG